jgi:hypothetical protein
MAGGAFQDPDLADVPIPPQLNDRPTAVGYGLGTRTPASGNFPHVTGRMVFTIADLPGETGAQTSRTRFRNTRRW